MKGIYTKEELNQKPKDFFITKYLDIDIPIEITEEEYVHSNDDLFLQKCIYLIKNNKFKKQ